ncbi:Tox-REase-5 domain-containing protein [Mycobacteroides chelonae]|uniref:Tox-REase-5 domain-containing protein n=1 Tax=Mycobacteroides chelonae TaxID=1774 RepID=UPI0032047FF7
MVTLDEFMAIKPNAYMAVVDSWRPRTAALKANYDDYKRWATTPNGTYWSGQFAGASQERAADDCKGTDNADDTTEDIAKLAAATIEYEVLPPLTGGQGLVERVLEHKDQGVSIDQQFNCDYHPSEGESDESIARNREHVKETERQIKEYVAKWEKATQTLKAQTDAARETMLSRINPKAALVDGRKILRDAKPGEPTAQPANFYKDWYPKATDPASTQAAAATATDPNAPVLGPPSPGDKPIKPDPTAGSFTGSLNKMGITDPKSPLDKPVPPPDARTVPAPKLDPNTPQGKAAIDKFRSILATQYPPDQVEAKLSEAIKGAQQDRPMVATPEPGTPERVRQSGGEAFAESWDQAGRAKDDLLGINGGDHAKEAWKGVAKGLWDVVNPDPVHQVERGIDRAEGAIDEVKSGIDNPKAFIGKHGIEIAAGIATAPVGGEGALLGTEGRALTHGLDDATPGHYTSAPGVDHPVPPAAEHNIPVGDHTPPAPYQPPTPHEFDPGAGQHYASGDPHHPGGWPPGTPEATWNKGDTEPGWKHINHNFDKDWMPYQEQIGGIERTPSGALPEWVQHDLDTGAPVSFDGHTYRGPQEVFLEAKDGFRGMAFAPDNAYWTGRAESALEQVDRQLGALPPGARLEWHVSDPYGAAALRDLFDSNGVYGVEVIYTPKP